MAESSAQTFPESISTHVNIPPGSDVSQEIALPMISGYSSSRLNAIGMEEAWINEAHAAVMFIWATTFCIKNPKQCFYILKTRERCT